MSRPKGSKNKEKVKWQQQLPQEVKAGQNPLENLPDPVETVVKRKRNDKRTVIGTTTNMQLETLPSLSGSPSVSPVITPEKKKVDTGLVRVIKGFVNVQRNPYGSYYLGGDIHDSLESAKSVASKPTVTQLYVAFEVKE